MASLFAQEAAKEAHFSLILFRVWHHELAAQLRGAEEAWREHMGFLESIKGIKFLISMSRTLPRSLPMSLW